LLSRQRQDGHGSPLAAFSALDAPRAVRCANRDRAPDSGAAHRRGGRARRGRIGLEKIETLALSLSEALKERRAYGANVGGAIVRLTAKGGLTFAAEPPRTSGKR
jgi:hypothetical protein